ncbi:TIGR03750 family conjugal transfer protein [Pasteurella skyensis]|uniref:TIGR03750 family conjugal transfer protein n=1 Tax=Phocoenobacter skyensis TaxID=97481 RepID=UPI00275D9E4F|nr:TIGR03750 family conjugal transfer protein [Pasteurella skyensis]MDP8189071.1 TIGR03750 family conjugal transfer protein [Pasteurella skyensis]
MTETSQHTQPHQTTISFIPDRLNRAPIVTRGMTMSELILAIITGVAIGVIFGVLVMFITGLDWYCIPASMLLFGWLATKLGGFYISRLKRGKPDSWLARFVDFKLNPSKFITVDETWSIKRTPKIKKYRGNR